MKTILRLVSVPIAVAILLSAAHAKPWFSARSSPQPSARAEAGAPPPNDTARFLAGMPLAKDSPLAPLTQQPAWQEHSANFEKAFAKLNRGKFRKLHAWQDIALPESKEPIPVVYYMFSGPDFLYLDQFFP
ncbi:MAG: hypothetical protein JWO45_657, partial [Spartobacteria bacterium]|nr:hypothetical protein [Spartobacteria bacterium]